MQMFFVRKREPKKLYDIHENNDGAGLNFGE